MVLDEDDLEFLREETGVAPVDFSVSGMVAYLDDAIARCSPAEGLYARAVTNILKGYRDDLGVRGTLS